MINCPLVVVVHVLFLERAVSRVCRHFFSVSLFKDFFFLIFFLLFFFFSF